MTHKFIVLSAAAMLVAAAGPATAQDSVPPPTPVQTGSATTPPSETTAQQPEESGPEQAQSAEQVPEKPAEKKPKKKADDWGFRWSDRPSLRLGSGTRVDFRVRFQGDLDHTTASLAGDDGEGSNVDVARRRIGIDGEIVNIFDYQVEGELGDDRNPWRDVYAELQAVRLRPGAGRHVQAAVQPRREHERHQPGLRVSLAYGGLARAGPRLGRHGTRPAASPRVAALRAGRFQGGRQ